MLVKITRRNIDRIGEGAIIVQYPLSGLSTAMVDISDASHMRVFAVSKVWRTSIDLAIPAAGRNIDFASGSASAYAVNKRQSDMVNEEKWWLYEEGLYS